MTSSQAIILITYAGEFLSSAELVEVCEKVIAFNLNEISSMMQGTSVLLGVFKGFVASKYSRDKILMLLIERISRDVDRLSTNEQCQFVKLLRFVEEEAAVKVYPDLVPFETSIEKCLKVVEPYILEQLNHLDFDELKDVYIGYSHPSLSQHPELLKVLETRIINLLKTYRETDLGEFIPIEDIVDMTYECAVHKAGSQKLITSLSSFLDSIMDRILQNGS
mmetsp:Transcript_10049/g.16927  ORF Transcript_10049/g.16927 Transcript_10049/m.16927 type:complete len:221 (+) Transcript_10049:1074-1736(+)